MDKKPVVRGGIAERTFIVARIPFLILLLTIRALFGQTSPVDLQSPPNTAVEVKRTPAAPTTAAPNAGNFVDQFDFGANVRALAHSMETPADAGAVAPAVHGQSAVPPTYRPATDVTLSITAQQAVQFSAAWRAQQDGAAPGPDGRVLFAFGAGLPTVVCAPLRVCLIELQPGEKLVGEPQIGDSVRWNVAPATYGKGEESTAMLVLKPQMPGLDTNLLITTDRRAYYVRLVSKADDYVSRVAFVYNDDDGGKKWKDHFAEQKQAELAAARDSIKIQPGLPVAFEHRFERDDGLGRSG